MSASSARSSLAKRLRRELAGDVLFDLFDRGRYATDASPYQSFPAGIVLPKTQEDVVAAIAICTEAGMPVTARGGGTGQAGQAVGEGVILDFSKYLTGLLYYDAQAKTCIVEPGITPAALNAALRAHRVWFPIDIASAAQATIGGMAGTDAMGWRALRYGRMRDAIVAMDTVLADGSEASFGEIGGDFGKGGKTGAARLVLDILEAAESHEEAIRALPQLPGAQRGYRVEALIAGEGPQNLAAFLAGSEGTLAIAKRIELKLARRPINRVLGLCHFPTVAAALAAVPAIASLMPSAIELIDRTILTLGLQGLTDGDAARRIRRKDSEAVLFVEFMEGNRVANARKLKELADAMAAQKHARAVSEAIGLSVQKALLAVRERGLRRLWEGRAAALPLQALRDFAIPLGMLGEAEEQLTALFARRGIPLAWHGQAGVGALHLHPLPPPDADPDALSEAADEAASHLRAIGGSLASDRGFGIMRSDAIEAHQGRRLTALYEEIKARFDPHNRLNPGKIVFPPSSQQAELRRPQPMAAVALPGHVFSCDGNGLCRSLDEGAMCPSFRLTRNERDSPRGRANTLRLAAAGELGPDGLASQAMAETLRLCVSCKTCRVECPQAVNIASAKIAFEAIRRKTQPLSPAERSAAALPHYGQLARRWRHLLNLRDVVPWMAPLSERLTGLSADRPWPRWRGFPFVSPAPIGDENGREILLFLDTFNSYFDVDALRAAADVLAAAGYRVQPFLPPPGERPFCCGRTLLEAGLLEEARAEARRLIAATAAYRARGVQMIGLEPACVFTLRDEWVNLLREDGAGDVAKSTQLFEEVLSQGQAAKTLAAKLHPIETEALLFTHCHQRAFATAPLVEGVAGLVPGLAVKRGEIACCGMGTSFGYMPGMVSQSLQMGEQALFPQIRRTGQDTLLLADGFACRKQIQDGTGRGARHIAVLLKLALLAGATPHAGHASAWQKRYFR